MKFEGMAGARSSVKLKSLWFGEESGLNRMVRDSDRRPNITISCDFMLIG